jgi:hypothetical protein
MPDLISVTLEPARLQLLPSGSSAPASAAVIIKNRSEEVGNYTLTIEGVQPDWCDISPNQLSAFPFQEVRAQVNVHFPAGLPSAIYRVTVCVHSLEREGLEGRGVIEVDVPAPAVQKQPVPPPPDAGKSGAQQQGAAVGEQRQAQPRPQTASQIELRVEPATENAPPLPALQWKLRLRNAGNVLDTFGFNFTGISQNWVSIDPVEMQLYPGEEGTALLVVRPGLDTPPAAYPFILRAFSHVNINERTEVALKIEIRPTVSFSLDISPREAESQGLRDFQVLLSSAANANADVWLDLSASDQDRACDYIFNPREVLLPARQRVASALRVQPRSVLKAGERKQYTFHVQAAPRMAGLPAQSVDGRLTQTGVAPVNVGLQPQVQSAEMEADYMVQVANPSAVDVSLVFSADDPEMACDYTFLPDRRYVPANGTSSTRLHVKARAANRGQASRPIAFTVKATRQGELLPTATSQGTFQQAPGRPLSIELIPAQQSQTGAAKYSVRVRNPFPTPINVWLDARDENDAVAFKLSPQGIRVPPGTDGLVNLVATPKDKLLASEQRRVHKFSVYATLEGAATPTTIPGTLAQTQGFDWGGPLGKLGNFIVGAIKLIFKVILWAIPWILLLLVLYFIANLGISALYYVATSDPQLGPIVTGLIPQRLIEALHSTLLFRTISDGIVNTVIRILAVISARMNPPATPTPQP